MPTGRDERITLAHGSGGSLMHELISEIILGELGNPVLDELDDAADLGELDLSGGRLALTTDSYVVQPLFFPGGDIGTLAVAGTVNDLAMKGARPAYLTLGLVVEEGLAVDDLVRVLRSIAVVSKEAGVAVAAGDTKVVERGAAGGLIVNTAGVGVIPAGRRVSASLAAEGDAVLVSGTIGDHEAAIVVAREDLRLEEPIESDCAPLSGLAEAVYDVCPDVHVMRDPTRGGLGTTLNEIAARSGTGITIREAVLPIEAKVAALCDILGFDPLYMANEGKMIVLVPADSADDVLSAMRDHPLGREAAVIGRVGGRQGVFLETLVGGLRPIVMLEGVQLPRIC
jgi:hydrogenase expression/formation protein HypE